MADMFLFMRHGWKSIWKQKNIWLFSVLPIFNQLFNIFRIEIDANLLLRCVWVILSFFFIILSFISTIGVPYVAYRSLIGAPATIQETLLAVKKFSGRVIGCSCLGLLVLSPIIFWILATSIDNSTRTLEISNNINLVILPLSIFTALGQFTIITFFEKDWGIRQSLAKAWNLFTSHFCVLAILGLILTVIFNVYLVISGLLTVLIQSGFDIASISNFNMLAPQASLSKNVLFVLLNGIGQIVFVPLRAFIFVSAYLKYSDVKLSFLTRTR
ncbi:MAG: hypothetical protein CVU44_13595 [Chloroflexi bacterium HGW-Chloroflexi-6]|nr:MAG: hypothetical protein CVU44_13595 [Chloroflexi bacterium HGW-Chloroflexi-6]